MKLEFTYYCAIELIRKYYEILAETYINRSRVNGKDG